MPKKKNRTEAVKQSYGTLDSNTLKEVAEILEAGLVVERRMQALSRGAGLPISAKASLSKLDTDCLYLVLAIVSGEDKFSKHPSGFSNHAVVMPLMDDPKLVLVPQRSQTTERLERGLVFKVFDTGEEFNGFPIFGIDCLAQPQANGIDDYEVF